MNRTSASLAAFDALRKGDAAPEWLTRAIGERWGLPSEFSVELIAVSENATFLVRVAGTPRLVLRLHRPGYVSDPRAVASELSWVEALREGVDVPVPRAVSGVDGSAVHTIADPDGLEWIAVAFEFVTGTVLEDDFADPAPWYERIGEITAQFHLFARRWRPPAGFTRFSWELDDMVGPASRWGDWRRAALDDDGRRIAEAAERTALAELAELDRSPSAWGIIHADLRPSNIMLTGDDIVVIDFDDCGHSWFLYDFAATLSFIEHLPHAPELAEAWRRGYSGRIPLSSQNLRHAAAFSMIRRLTMLGWTTTHREDALPAELWAAQAPGTVELAARYLERPLWIFGG